MTLQDKPSPVTVFGYGPTGEATVKSLRTRGQAVRVAQRKRPANLPAGVEFMAVDVLDETQVRAAMEGAGHAVITTGFEYSGKVWKKVWPKAMANFIAAAEASGARVIQVDNMYMYGPQKTDAPIAETAPLTTYGVKPATRAKVTRQWQAAAAEGRVRWAALRAPDFYGPGVDRSHIGETGLIALARGKSATSVMPLDTPHAFAYVPDIGRAVVSLIDADDADYNQAWHVPCAPTQTPRQILQIGADALGQKLRVAGMSGILISALGLFIPFLKEVAEMSFTWERPYHVDSRKFARRFWSDATPLEVGVRETALSFQRQFAAEPHTQKAAA